MCCAVIRVARTVGGRGDSVAVVSSADLCTFRTVEVMDTYLPRFWHTESQRSSLSPRPSCLPLMGDIQRVANQTEEYYALGQFLQSLINS